VVWASIGLGDPDADPDDAEDVVLESAPIPVLRVRARTSPDVLPFH